MRRVPASPSVRTQPRRVAKRRLALSLAMDEEEDERLPVVPLGDRKLRACLVTGLVKTEDQVPRRHPRD